MKVITIKQPWATLIAKGYKKYEFRSWKTKYRGELLIHAGMGVDKKYLEMFEDLNLEFPKGVIVAKVNLTDCIEVTKEFSDALNKTSKVYPHDYTGYNAWKLDNVEEIKSTKVVKGKLSIWNIDEKDYL